VKVLMIDGERSALRVMRAPPERDGSTVVTLSKLLLLSQGILSQAWYPRIACKRSNERKVVSIRKTGLGKRACEPSVYSPSRGLLCLSGRTKAGPYASLKEVIARPTECIAEE
jgi:hypothetical protein